MAKKKPAPEKVDLVETAERGVRASLSLILGDLPEAEYVEKSLDALDLVVEVLKMRQQELQQGE